MLDDQDTPEQIHRNPKKKKEKQGVQWAQQQRQQHFEHLDLSDGFDKNFFKDVGHGLS